MSRFVFVSTFRGISVISTKMCIVSSWHDEMRGGLQGEIQFDN